MGSTAIRHQRNIRLHINKPHLVYPDACVLPQCAAYGAPCSIQHELFDCPAVQPMWAYTHRLMAELDHDPVHIATLYHVWRFIILNGTDATPQQGPIATTILKVNLVALTVKAVWDAYRTKIKHHQDGAPSDKVAATHRDECIHRYKALLKAEIKQLPHHIHALHSRRRFPSQKTDGNKYEGERKLILRPKFHYDPHALRPAQELQFAATWCKTHCVSVIPGKRGKQLLISFPPFYPP